MAASLNRRAALIGAALSTTALAFPAGSLVRAKEPETVPELARRLSAALEQAGEPWQVIVTASGHQINLDGPVDPWQQLVNRLDARAAGFNGWILHCGRSGMTGETWGRLHGVRIVEEEVRAGLVIKVQRDTELGRI